MAYLVYLTPDGKVIMNSSKQVQVVQDTTPIAITITKSPYVSSVYLSSSASATSGSASGTSFNSGTTVYGFATLAGYVPYVPGGWTLISGTALSQGALYRIGSRVVSQTTNSFGKVTVSDDNSACMVKFTGSGNVGTITWYTKNIQSSSDCASIEKTSSSTSITAIADYSDYNGTTKAVNLLNWTCSSSYEASYSLINGNGSTLNWNSWYNFVDIGPLTIVINTATASSSGT